MNIGNESNTHQFPFIVRQFFKIALPRTQMPWVSVKFLQGGGKRGK